jgi:hypothetical protein
MKRKGERREERGVKKLVKQNTKRKKKEKISTAQTTMHVVWAVSLCHFSVSFPLPTAIGSYTPALPHTSSCLWSEGSGAMGIVIWCWCWCWVTVIISHLSQGQKEN